MTRTINDNNKSRVNMSMNYEERSRAAKLGWIAHDLASLKRSYASVKGWKTRRRNIQFDETNLFVISLVNSLVDILPPTSLVVIPDSITCNTVFSNSFEAEMEF